MVTMRAVVEVGAFHGVFATPWPVASTEPDPWLVLDGHCGDEHVGLFVAALANRLDVPAPGGRDDVVDTLLGEELLIVAGGLRISDAGTGVAVIPGCCFGLEDWRNWAEVLAGGLPWLGHNPGAEVEAIGDQFRVWQDGGPGRRRGRWAGVHVDVPRSALPELLTSVQRDLVGFLAALAGWGERIGLGQRGDALVEAVDRDFAIAAPLDLPGAAR